MYAGTLNRILRSLLGAQGVSLGTLADPIDVGALPFTSNEFNVSGRAGHGAAGCMSPAKASALDRSAWHGTPLHIRLCTVEHALSNKLLLGCPAPPPLQASQTIEQAGDCSTAPVAGLVFR